MPKLRKMERLSLISMGTWVTFVVWLLINPLVNVAETVTYILKHYYRPQRSCDNVMFYTCLWFCSQVRRMGLCQGDHPGQRPPWTETPTWQRPLLHRGPCWAETPPGQRPLLDRNPSWRERLLDRDPPGQRPLLDRDPPTETPGQRSPHTVTSGRYASYWNAFLFSSSEWCYICEVYVVKNYLNTKKINTRFENRKERETDEREISLNDDSRRYDQNYFKIILQHHEAIITASDVLYVGTDGNRWEQLLWIRLLSPAA